MFFLSLWSIPSTGIGVDLYQSEGWLVLSKNLTN
jgi:hypothetical protein